MQRGTDTTERTREKQARHRRVTVRSPTLTSSEGEVSDTGESGRSHEVGEKGEGHDTSSGTRGEERSTTGEVSSFQVMGW